MLETKIEALTIVIERLTAQLQGQQPATQQPETQEPEAKEAPAQVTHDQLRDLFITKSREDSSKKVKIKELLKLYGAAKVNDVEQGDLSEIYAEGQQL